MKTESVTTTAGLWPSATTRDLLWITLGVGILFFVALGARDLWNPNEPIYGRAVAEMAERGDWLIPTVNEKVFAEKPILYFWSALAASKVVGGVSELSLRIPTATAALLSAYLTYLLILPYSGRRRARLAVAIFATLFQVFWAARAVQMDILVLASTLGVVVPLTRMLDFQMRTAPAFALAGLAAGLGFLAKGPVTLVLPAIVLVGYAAWSGRTLSLLHRHLILGVLVAIAVSLPWYAMLWFQGEIGFLYEVLFRQNVTRFLDAWDHQQPWWYFLKYVWIDYAPWALLLPAAALMPVRNDRERRLHGLSWIWILGVIAFFSLSESKRAPYILPVAPAVAILASGVVERWVAKCLERKARLAARFALGGLALFLFLAGAAAFLADLFVPIEFASVGGILSLLLAATGSVLVFGIFAENELPKMAPSGLLAGVSALYMVAAIWALPAIDPLKSARGFSAAMNRSLQEADGSVASFLFWDWRSGYSYYGNRSIPGLKTPSELTTYWRETASAHVLVENEDSDWLLALLPDAHLIQEGKIGSRRAYLFAKNPAPARPQNSNTQARLSAPSDWLVGLNALNLESGTTSTEREQVFARQPAGD